MNKFMGHKMKRKTEGRKRGPESSVEDFFFFWTQEMHTKAGGRFN